MFDALLSAGGRAPDEDPFGGLGTAGPAGSGAVELLDRLVPPPVDHVLVQADLTVVLPGPAEPDLAGELALATEAESAHMYRGTADSVPRGLDARDTAADPPGLVPRRAP